MNFKQKILISFAAALILTIYSCEGQECDTIVIDNPEHSEVVAEVKRLQDLTEQYLTEALILNDAVSTAKAQLDSANGEISNLNESVVTLNNQISALKSSNSDLKASNDDLSSQLETISAENAAIVAGLEGQIAERNATIETQTGTIASLEQVEANLKAEKSALEAERDNLVLIADVLRDEKAAMEQENNNLIAENTTLKEALDKKIDTVYTEVVVRDTVAMDELEIEGVVYSSEELKKMLASDVRTEVIYNTCYRTASKRSWLHVGGQDVYPHYIEIPFLEASLQPVQFDEKPHDFLVKYQLKYKLTKIQNHRDAKTVYKNTGEIPFQIFAMDSVADVSSNFVTVRTFGSETHGIKYYLDGELYDDFSDLSVANPGEAFIEEYPVYRHTKRIEGLSPNTEYELRFVVNNAAGETDERTVTIKTNL